MRSLIFQSILDNPFQTIKSDIKNTANNENGNITDFECSRAVKNLYYEIVLRKKRKDLFITYADVKLSLEKYGLGADDDKLVESMLDYLDKLVSA